MNQILWQPTPEQIENTQLTQFTRFAEETTDSIFTDYFSLHHWSVTNPGDFWSLVWAYCNVSYYQGWDHALVNPELMPGAQWFTNSTLNYAANLLRFNTDQPAIIYRHENGERRSITFQGLRSLVGGLAHSLEQQGITKGDRVAGFMPNLPETVIAMLATSSLGAVWSSCSPDFGVDGVVDRFGQIEPKILFAGDSYSYKGKLIDVRPTIKALMERVPSIQRVVVVPFQRDVPLSIKDLPRAVQWNDFIAAPQEPHFLPVAFTDPLFIMYSSGTTGKPKCIVHGVGGTLLQHLKELVLHTDVRRGERILYITTCGWMMWNWLVSSLATGATIVLYEGAPFYPSADALWRLADEENISVFGTSAKYLAALEKNGVKPKQHYALNSLRAILSTGSPLAPEQFDFVYQHIKSDVQLASISGGTDIISCFALGNPNLPVRRGELQCAGLGMDIKIFDENGNAIVGQQGELVCTTPFPSMPIQFWNDPDGDKYRAAYFERFSTLGHVWHHGDFAEQTEKGGFIIFGRSDATLNPGGVRIGTAEIYRQVEKLDEIVESLAVGREIQNDRGDVEIVLFVVLRDPAKWNDVLQKKIRDTIRANTTARHVPAAIYPVPDLPRTRNGKLSEIAARDTLNGRTIKNTEALANPESLALLRAAFERSVSV